LGCRRFQYRPGLFPSLSYEIVPKLLVEPSLGGRHMGMRGRHANPRFKHWRSPDEPALTTISPEAISIYRRMRRLEWRCECPDDGDLETMCVACTKWWELQRQLARCLGLFEGLLVFEDPSWNSFRPSQCAIDRFHELERASKSGRKQKFQFKWQR
jgi:hypothetical protein